MNPSPIHSKYEGLTHHEAEKRLAHYGPNQIRIERRFTAFRLLKNNLLDPFVILLFVAFLLTILLGDPRDTTLIGIVIVFQIILGFALEYRSEATFRRLTEFAEKQAIVIRSEKEMIVSASQIVPGDLVKLSGGREVPADVEITKSYNLSLDESLLTGESMPQSKTNGQDAFLGSLVVGGEGWGKVLRTGEATELGRIKRLVQVEKSDSPLHREVRRISMFLGAAAFAVIAIVFLVGIVRGENPAEFLLRAIVLAVATVPEGLPLILTLVLAGGMRRLLERNILVRTLKAVDVFGRASVVLTDKTGTITRGSFELIGVLESERLIEARSFERSHGTGKLDPAEDPAHLMTKLATVSIDRFSLLSPPLLAFAATLGIDPDEVERAAPLEYREPFSSATKISTEKRVIRSASRQDGAEMLTALIGAPEVVLARCSRVAVHPDSRTQPREHREKTVALPADAQKNILAAITAYERKGYRMLSVAHRVGSEDGEGFTFLGTFVFADAIREDAPDAVRDLEQLGARLVVVTGDAAHTAEEVAVKAGIIANAGEAFTDADGAHLDDPDFEKTAVWARATPERKYRLVERYQAAGHIVAMIGDGVNDAPALRRADIGIALGSGTEVAKSASDVVLLDNSLAGLVFLMRQARRIVHVLQKAIMYFTTLSTDLLTLFAMSVIFGLPAPLAINQILFLNVIEDSVIGSGFVLMGGEVTVKKIIGRRELLYIGAAMAVMVASSVIAFSIALRFPDYLQGIIFLFLGFNNLLMMYRIKSFPRVTTIHDLRDRKFFVLLVVSGALLAAAFVAPLNALFGLAVPPLPAIGELLLLELGMMVALEAVKRFIP